MEAKKLMLGDYIKTDNTSWDEELKDRICKVEFIGHEYLACVTIDGERKPFGNEKGFDPIPLTPEILEKNGFVLNEEEVGMYGVKVAPHYTREDLPFEVFCDGEPFAIWFKDPVNIKYVHELQRALKLCGIQKEIVI